MALILCLVGGYLTLRLGFIQITGVKDWLFKTLKTLISGGKSNGSLTVSGAQSLYTSLAATLGTGNIAGVATAIAIAGPGAVFWMWCSAFLSMAIGFSENALGMLYRKKMPNGKYSGGAVGYIERGLKSKPLAVLYALLLSVSAFGIGNLVQINSAAVGVFDAVKGIFGRGTAENKLVILGIIAFLTFFVAWVTLGGIKTVASLCEKLVPVMAVAYILACFVVLAVNLKQIPNAFCRIFANAFNLKSVLGGGAGYSVAYAVKQGVAFGAFSNEAGLGSSVSGHADVEHNSAYDVGTWSMFEIFTDTVVLCTLTALVILTSSAYSESEFLNILQSGREPTSSVTLAANAFYTVFGNFANTFISVMMVLFAVSSTAAWAYYGTSAVNYASNNNKVIAAVYKALFIGIVPLGALFHSNLVWNLSEALNVTLCIPNLIAVVILTDDIREVKRRNLKNVAKKSIGNS